MSSIQARRARKRTRDSLHHTKRLVVTCAPSKVHSSASVAFDEESKISLKLTAVFPATLAQRGRHRIFTRPNLPGSYCGLCQAQHLEALEHHVLLCHYCNDPYALIEKFTKFASLLRLFAPWTRETELLEYQDDCWWPCNLASRICESSHWRL